MTTATPNAASGSHAAPSSTKRSNLTTTLPALGKTLLRLTPRQLQDEVQIALLELKKKGIGIGVAAGLFGAALVFVMFMLTSLLVSLITVIADQPHVAFVALMVALAFLVIAAILALVGLSKVKKNLPLTPNRAIRGIKHDLGILKEGRAFDERTLVDTRTKEQREADAKRAAEEKEAKKRQEKIDKGIDPDAKPLTLEQLVSLTSQRRQNIAATRDELITEAPLIEGDKMGGTSGVVTLKSNESSAPATPAEKAQAFKANAADKFSSAKLAAATRLEQAKAVAAEKKDAIVTGKPASAVGVHDGSAPVTAADRAKELKTIAADKISEAKLSAATRIEQAKAVAAEKKEAAANGTSTEQVGVHGGSASANGTISDRLKERKGAVAAAGASLSAFAVLANKLSKRK